MKHFEKPMSVQEMKAVRDADIDFSDIPEADTAFWQTANVQFPDRPKLPINAKFDADMLEWFKAQGRGYQARMNAVLRSYFEAHKQPPAGDRSR